MSSSMRLSCCVCPLSVPAVALGEHLLDSHLGSLQRWTCPDCPFETPSWTSISTHVLLSKHRASGIKLVERSGALVDLLAKAQAEDAKAKEEIVELPQQDEEEEFMMNNISAMSSANSSLRTFTSHRDSYQSSLIERGAPTDELADKTTVSETASLQSRSAGSVSERFESSSTIGPQGEDSQASQEEEEEAGAAAEEETPVLSLLSEKDIGAAELERRAREEWRRASPDFFPPWVGVGDEPPPRKRTRTKSQPKRSKEERQKFARGPVELRTAKLREQADDYIRNPPPSALNKTAKKKTAEQLEVLWTEFRREPFLKADRCGDIITRTGLRRDAVVQWFENTRKAVRGQSQAASRTFRRRCDDCPGKRSPVFSSIVTFCQHARQVHGATLSNEPL